MTHCNTEKLAGSPCQELLKIDSLKATRPRIDSQFERESDRGRRRGRLFSGAVASLVCALCVATFAVSPTSAKLFAQPPSGEVSQAATDETTATPAAMPSLPGDLDFDIDLGTEEFENFGEEDFKVEEANYVRDTVVPMAIKVAIGAVVILLFAWVAMKLVKPKRPTSPE